MNDEPPKPVIGYQPKAQEPKHAARSSVPRGIIVGFWIAHAVFGLLGGLIVFIANPPMGESETTPVDIVVMVWGLGTLIVFPLIHMSLIVIDARLRRRTT